MLQREIPGKRHGGSTPLFEVFPPAPLGMRASGEVPLLAVAEGGQQRRGLGTLAPRHPPRTPHIEKLRHDHASSSDHALGGLTLPSVRGRPILKARRGRPAAEHEPQPARGLFRHWTSVCAAPPTHRTRPDPALLQTPPSRPLLP